MTKNIQISILNDPNKRGPKIRVLFEPKLGGMQLASDV
jgi:hypothetical protein